MFTLRRFKNSKKVIRTKKNSVFGVYGIYGVKLLTRFRLYFSHLTKHMFRHNFNNTLNPMCNCGVVIELTINSCAADLVQINEWSSLMVKKNYMSHLRTVRKKNMVLKNLL